MAYPSTDAQARTQLARVLSAWLERVEPIEKTQEKPVETHEAETAKAA